MAQILEIWSAWHPDPWIAGALKAIGIVASLAAFAILLPLVPSLESLRRHADPVRLGGKRNVADPVTLDAAKLSKEPTVSDEDQRYRLLAEAMPQPVFTTTSTGVVDYFNPAWYSYTGLTQNQTHTGAWDAVVHPDDLARCTAAWTDALRNADPYEAEMRLRRASDGVYRWHICRAIPIDWAGEIAKWIGSCSDIHDFKIPGETRMILDRLDHIISIRNDDGIVEYVSPTCSQITGVEADKCADSDWRTLLHPDDLGLLHSKTRSDVDPAPDGEQSEVRVRTTDGRYRWFAARSVALPKTAGTRSRHLDALTDIDELKRVQAAHTASEQRYHTLTDALPQMIYVIDEQANVEYVNAKWLAYTGLTFEPGMQSKTSTLVHSDDLAVLDEAHLALRAQQSHDCELRLRSTDGVYRWHLLRIVPLGEKAQIGTKWIVTATDIQAYKSAEAALAHSAAELTHRAHHDALTDLPNRTILMDRLTEMIVEGKRDGTDVIVLYLNIDHFKAINDTLGHNSGDRLLVETAARIRTALRAEDTASRFGGDEFVLICTAAGGDEAPLIAERIAAAVRAPIELDGKRVTVGSSIGISVFPKDGSDPADLIQKADAAMHAAKHNGRNAWCLYSEQTHLPAAMPALEFEAELREAIALDQFVIHYQPIISVETGRPMGAEALVRWAHPERGLLSPAEFIPFAETHGLIAPIGELVLNAACAQLRRLNLRAGDNFTIAVNVSARQFAKPGFVATIAAAIAAHGLDARRLEIEITESVVMGDTAAVIATLDELEGLGVKLSIDDFGTGYSSLAYIKNFPIHTLKIDRSFVSDIALNFTDQAIAKTIVTLAHSLGMRVIAEGVETTQQLEQLRLFGADCIQGYLISRPLPAPDFEDFLAGRRSMTQRTPKRLAS